MNTESNSKYNKHIKNISENIEKLRKIQYDKNKNIVDKYFSSNKIIEDTILKLIDRKNYLLFRPFWNEIHDRMVYYYNFMNKININKKIPLFRMTLHNEAISWWLKLKDINKLKGPLVHCDTHEDMGEPESTKYLIKKNGKIDREGIDKGACGLIFWPVTCLLLAKGTNEVVWATPKWTYDNDIRVKQILTTDKKNKSISYIRSENEKKDEFMYGDIIVKEEKLDKKYYNFYHPFIFNRIKLHKKSGWKKLNKVIEKFFILDIDLDFFVSNGDKISLKEYKEDFNDVESHKRIHNTPGITIPREMYSDEYSIEIIKKLNQEEKIIRKRIKHFLENLEELKNDNKIPSAITISDSCSTYFSGISDRAVFTNEYTPKYFVPLIHLLLLNGFKKIYGNKVFF
tara:strand:+ start:354 stop:1550 length:1197 start_codon:yes stop_codon:yes gene_type:complete